MPDRVLVTGAAGFVGSHLCRRLVADGYTVVGLDDLSEGSLDNLRDVPEVVFVEGDLRDAYAVRRVARECVAILHQGAKRAVPRSMVEPGLITDVNVGGTLNVILAARDAQATVVLASSSSVYGNQETFPLHENMMPAPRSPYAASKLAAEIYCGALYRSFGVPTVALRYFNVYGPGMDPESEYALVVPKFVVSCLTGAPATIHGDGEQARDFTYIDDVVEANLLATRAPEEAFGRAFNIGGGAEPVSVNQLLDLISEICSSTPERIHQAPREGDVRLTMADISLARELLGFRPSVGIEEGLRRTVASFMERVA